MYKTLIMTACLLGAAPAAWAREPGALIQLSGTVLSVLGLIALLGLVRVVRRRH